MTVTESAPSQQIGTLIINGPYEEPRRYWKYHRETKTFTLVEGGRRPAGYVVATPGSKAFDDPGLFQELPLVNIIRRRVNEWREKRWPGVTGTTRRLLEHWYDEESRPEGRRFFFCQLEAIETLIWLIEASPADVQGIVVPSDGGAFQRYCSKLATGTGKTIVMGMLIAWQVLNKVNNEARPERFSKNILVVAPGLTVKSRLQVLQPSAVGNYYDEFAIVPGGMMEKLRLGRVIIHNWHKLDWDSEEQIAKKRSVDKRGAMSDEAYVRDVLGEMAPARNVLVINDEAHHAWRVEAGKKIAGIAKSEKEQATKWIGGLDRIHRARGILGCFDFSATPFVPTGKQSTDERLFEWIVSDFGLNDAIEAGLVKTPRVVVRDDGVPDAATYRSRLYHIYNDDTVKDDVNQPADEHVPLPDLVTMGYYLLGKDWLETLHSWQENKQVVPPVMITVANRTETAARIKYAFDHGKIRIDELCSREKTLHIDSKVLDKAEQLEEPVALDTAPADENGDGDDDGDEADDAAPRKGLTKLQQAELLRRIVDTVGRVGEPGEQIQKVISVGMLSEGWDAKTVTHIMGLRAFSSQLLCEQVVGRGLRRTSYDVNPKTGLFEAEYVNIFGVPFTFLPHEGGDGPPPPPPPPKIKIEPVKEKAEHAITWPNIIKIEPVYRPVLDLEWSQVPTLTLSATDCVTRAEIAPTVDGKADLTKLSEIDLEQIARRFRIQKIIFETARDIFDQMKPNWSGAKEALLVQLIRLVETFIGSDRLQIDPPLFYQDEMRRRVLLTLSMNRIVQHFWEAIRFQRAEKLTPVFDPEKPLRSTGDMRPWFTGRPCEHNKRSHINFVVYDSTWEASDAYRLDHSPHVKSWVKNDHLGFEIWYVYRGVRRRFFPDFLVRLANDMMLVLETKGEDTEQNRAKRRFLDEWINAVNAQGSFGTWVADVSMNPAETEQILVKHGAREA